MQPPISPPPYQPLLQRGHPLACALWVYWMYMSLGLCWTLAVAAQAWSAISNGDDYVRYLIDFFVILWLFGVPGLGVPALYRARRQQWGVAHVRIWPGLAIVFGTFVLSLLVYLFPVLGSSVSAYVDLALVLALLICLLVAFVRLRPVPPPSETSGTPTYQEMQQFYDRYEL